MDGGLLLASDRDEFDRVLSTSLQGGIEEHYSFDLDAKLDIARFCAYKRAHEPTEAETSVFIFISKSERDGRSAAAGAAVLSLSVTQVSSRLLGFRLGGLQVATATAIAAGITITANKSFG